MEAGTFSLVPLEVIKDSRLTLRQIKVLVALLSFRSKNTDVVFPSRKKLSDRTGIRETTISLVTAELEQLGWLTKEGKGGFSKSTRYTITVPDLGTVHDLSTVPDLSTSTVPKPSTSTVPSLSTGKEYTNEYTNEHTNSRDTAPKGRSASRLPEDWELPDEWAIWAKQNRPDLNPNQVADQFKDYWIAVAGAKGRKQDWFATWRNWVRNQRATNKQGEPDWLKAKREWYEEAAGKTPAYKKDIFDIALEEDRNRQLRIAK
jgi:hypothetical protein